MVSFDELSYSNILYRRTSFVWEEGAGGGWKSPFFYTQNNV